ncbi:hypothetical protein B7486_63035, partial [cyanobacterium TDX16]
MPKTTPQHESIDLAAIEAELRPQSSERLKVRFFECFKGAAEFIAEAAVCVMLLEERGEELTGIPYVGTYRRIAAGQVDPSAFWRFIESPNRQRVERLPLPDQKRLAADPMVEIAEGSTVRKVDLTQAPREVAKVVIGPDGIRSPDEQRAFLGQQKAKAMVRPTAKTALPKERRDRRLPLMLTTAEMSALMDNAAGEGLSDHDYAIRMLERAGAFKR